MDLEEIKADLDDTGYCIVEGVMPAEEADRMADRYFELHKQHFPNQQSYQSLQGLLNYDQMCWSWALHPQILELACHYLGRNMRFAEACSKWVMPGGKLAVFTRMIWGCLSHFHLTCGYFKQCGC